MRLLFVCTGNICRSPVAERLTLARASRALGGSPQLQRVEVLSAGVRATPGQPMQPFSGQALEALGGDPTGFSAQRLTAELAESADLVLTMTRRHRDSVLRVFPRGMRRTFTLAEASSLVVLADLAGLAATPIDERARELARRLDAARVLRRAGEGDDITDPMGQDSAAHAAVAARIDQALVPVTDVLFPDIQDRLAAVPA